MTALRDEIRAILREELAAVLTEHCNLETHSVRIESSDDLNAFAHYLAARLEDTVFSQNLRSGVIRFVLERSISTPSVHTPKVAAPLIPARIQNSTSAPPFLDKRLITETDLVGIAPGTLRVPRGARLTPLAKDEARRKGVRIERIET